MSFYDTSRDGQLTPIDAMRVLNGLQIADGKSPVGELFVAQSSQRDEDNDDGLAVLIDKALSEL